LVALGVGGTGKREEALLGYAASVDIEMSEAGRLRKLSVCGDERELKNFFATPSRKMVAKK
jgi:hypothetical protein